MKKILLFIAILVVLTFAAGVFFVSKYRASRKPAPVVVVKTEDAKFTIIEGWNLGDIADALENGKVKSGPVIPAKDFLALLKDFDTKDFPLVNQRPKNTSLEGFLFPDTYFVPASSTVLSEALIEKALTNFEKKFTADMRAQAQKGNVSVYDVVTLASIIERETGRSATTGEQKAALEEERKIVAGIFYNRLNIGMPLQSDATVNYVTGKSTPQPSTEDLEAKSPYNTYQNTGLPPGPISNPSLSSLMAALYPTKTNYLYFLHDQRTGKAYYGETFEQHIQNRYKYLP